MAKALVEIVGDSASAVRALEQTSVALTSTGDAAKKAAVDMDAYAASAARAQATRADTLLAQSASLKQLSASSAAGSSEQMAANELALKRQTQAYKLLGIQAATTRTSLTQTAGTIGRGLTTYVTAPAAFIGYEAVKQAMDYQQAILLIRTQAGASVAELNHMNSAVLQLVQSGHSYGQSAHDMAQGLYYVESEGIRGGRALAILQAAAAGAAKGQTSMVDTTNALTSAMKIWNVSASGAATTMATIDAITATGKMHLEDLNNAFQTKFFTTAKQLGIPLEQAGAALDVFTKAGVPAETAANNMTTSFIKMLTPAKAAVPYLQQLGLSTNSLGQALQSGGLSRALAELSAGYEHIVQTQGKFQANRAVLESFGGSRSGAPALALVQQYATYLQSLGQIQRLNNPATFWSQVSEAMDSPTMKVKQSVAEIGADFIKLGTALAPTVASIAGGVAKISSAFGELPGPIKDSIGVIVATLAIAGPVGLAIKGVGSLLGALGTAFRMLGPAAATGAAAADASVEGIGAASVTATAEVGALRTALLSLAGPAAILGGLALGAYELSKSHGFTHVGGNVYEQHGQYYLHPQGAAAGRGPAYEPISAARAQQLVPGLAAAAARRRQAADAARHAGSIGSPGGGNTGTHGGTHFPPPPVAFALPQNLQLEMAKAQAGFGSITKAQEDERRYILNMIHSGRLTGAALVQAYQALASLGVKATADAHKAQAAFLSKVHSDQLLAQARIDLANGETAAAQQLLSKDQARLRLMLAEAKTADERTAVLRALGEVERLRHSKSSAFALSPKLQEEIAKADAQAALTPNLSGPTARQMQLARQAKAAAMHAINSHMLTLQGLTSAWQIVGQENAVLARAKGAIDTYHAVYSKGIVDSVKGLSQAQQMQLRERIAQAEAHRGYAPNGPNTQRHTVDVRVHVESNDSHIVKVVDKHRRQSHVRAGGRR